MKLEIPGAIHALIQGIRYSQTKDSKYRTFLHSELGYDLCLTITNSLYIANSWIEGATDFVSRVLIQHKDTL